MPIETRFDAGAFHLFFVPHTAPGPELLRERLDGFDLVTAVELPQAADAAHGPSSSNAFELLCDGLTFDLQRSTNPLLARTFDWRGDGDDMAAAEILVLGLGPHLSGGGPMLPVIRSLAAAAARLVQTFGNVLAIGWAPAALKTAPQDFVTDVERWRTGGAFPMRCFIGFGSGDDGQVVSRGLAYFTGQEFSMAAEISADPEASHGVAERIASWLVRYGRLAAPRILADTGERVVHLEPHGSEILVRPA